MLEPNIPYRIVNGYRDIDMKGSNRGKPFVAIEHAYKIPCNRKYPEGCRY